ncbi:MAG: class I SAM-dependent methyltransferase [Janthinobacterium lividum]
MAPLAASAPVTRRFFGQGVWNIVRFNWPFYALALAAGAAGLLLRPWLPAPWRALVGLGLGLAGLLVLASLVVSAYVYDCSGLYKLDWLLRAGLPTTPSTLLTVSAGFDELSPLLHQRLPGTHLLAFDFYDPAQHTEASIRRARAAYPPWPGTRAVGTGELPLPTASVQAVIAFLAAHEVRNAAERAAFFRELGRVAGPGAPIIVVEHLRDAANFMAYTVGFLHFHSRCAWLATFRAAELRVAAERKLTPFLSVFTLYPNAASA